MRETVRIIATFVLQALGVYYGVGVILLAIERYPENGALLTGVLVLFLESICVLMVVGGAHARGKRRSAGFPLDDPNQEPRT
jgi:hypothetical protein